MAKTGRPPKSGKRHPNGQLARPRPGERDRLGPTPEQLKRCIWLTGARDTRLAECPLGVLVAHALIGEEQWKTASRYRDAKKILYGSYQPAAGSDGIDRGHDSTGDTKGTLWATGFLRKMEALLERMPSRRLRDAVHNFIVEERFPAWMQKGTSLTQRMAPPEDFPEVTQRLLLSPAHTPELERLLELIGIMHFELAAKKAHPFQKPAGEAA